MSYLLIPTLLTGTFIAKSSHYIGGVSMRWSKDVICIPLTLTEIKLLGMYLVSTTRSSSPQP
jgi:hypothetical protein